MLCLPQDIANKIKDAIKSRKLSPQTLMNMDSAQRRAFLAELLGQITAKDVNLLFEKKLLLKNQERAMYDWAKEITGLSKADKEATLAKIRQTYADKARRLYEPKDNENFLNEITSDIFSKKYKVEVSLQEAQIITELTAVMREAKVKLEKEGISGFGAAKVALDSYVNGLKLEANKRTWVNPLRQIGIKEKLRIVNEDIGTLINFIAENSRAIVASVDNSWWGRQGIKTLITKPKTWSKNFIKSFSDIGQTLKYGNVKGDAIIDGVKAEIYERQSYLKGLYDMGKKLDIGTGEEAFPTSAPAKIPFLGRLFKASEISYEAGAMRMRADVADQYYALAEKMGVDLTDKFEVGSINEMVNSLTGRGRLPLGAGSQKAINNAFFSIKFFKSNLDTLTLHAGSKMSTFARKQAAINLLRIVSGIGAMLFLAWSLDKDSVDWDPRSANFGKIKVGNTRFDITGGMSSLITLVFRIMRQSSKSSTTDIVSKLNDGYGSQTGMDVLWGFTENKFSPMFSVIRDLVKQETFGGDKPTIFSTTKGLAVPIVVQNYFETSRDPNSANLLLAMIADGLGISTNTYTLETKWEQSTSQELMQFKAKVGSQTFKEANDKYNLRLNDYILGLITNPDYKKLSNEEKLELVSFAKDKIKQGIFDEYGFKYKKGIIPQFKEGDESSNQGVIDQVVLYAKAMSIDPITAFNRIFTGQRIRRIDNNAIIVERMPFAESQAVKAERGAEDEMILDHTIPLELGGSNSKRNLQLVPMGLWKSYTPIENHLGGLLRMGKIDRKEAQRLIQGFKNGEITSEIILAM